jgi:four helix bundle protein
MLKSYRDLEVWKRALLLVADIYRVTRKLPSDERFGLTAQMRRAAVSVTSNIAEGYGRSTRGEYLNHLSIARGSLYELESLCEACQMLSLLTSSDLTTVAQHLVHVRRLLRRLIEALRRAKKAA